MGGAIGYLCAAKSKSEATFKNTAIPLLVIVGVALTFVAVLL